MTNSINMLVLPDLKAKSGFILPCQLFVLGLLWMIGNVMDAYSLYYSNHLYLVSYAGIPYVLSIILFLHLMFEWLRIAAREQSSSFSFSMLTMDEYRVFLTLFATFLYGILPSLWCLCTKDYIWQTHGEATLTFEMTVHYFFTIFITGIHEQLFLSIFCWLIIVDLGSFSRSFASHSCSVEYEYVATKANLRPRCLPRDQVWKK